MLINHFFKCHDLHWQHIIFITIMIERNTIHTNNRLHNSLMYVYNKFEGLKYLTSITYAKYRLLKRKKLTKKKKHMVSYICSQFNFLLTCFPLGAVVGPLIETLYSRISLSKGRLYIWIVDYTIAPSTCICKVRNKNLCSLLITDFIDKSLLLTL